MSFFAKFLGDGAKTPEALATVDQVGAALDMIARERQHAADSRRDLIQRRHEALASDASDKQIQAIDAQIDALALVEDRLEILQPRLLRRMDELQSANRRETLRVLELAYQDAEAELDRAMAAVLGPLDRFLEITRQLEASGFSAEARTIVTEPPMIGGGLLVSHETIERYRRTRESLQDAKARAANPIPAPTPQPSKVIPMRPRREIDHGDPRVTPPRAKREPISLSTPVAAGMTRIRCQLNDVDYQNRQCIIGDTFDVTREEASYLLRGTAFVFVAGEETVKDVAE